ncbi:chromosome segregation protein SMC [Aliidiomarina minuta]|uniref:Chromosome partition protein Smc n=1 Tax=Aliidiomarina minuta TaxID=880057 RepID=A0A432W7W2_9GAMM|nr:chromosome segregation protein SMC [Aliidiomarina minuta]RUO26091.1 chromosome segregation protein SMC [Aliidiomarina minuta]
MRLKHIKLVGFKSFVDATKVPFPEQMTCVVGPNGCGKSNVIDAVRWVLGESSAKNLRGDAMTDVIFNGSTSRKPVSQASVELVFDNSSGRLQGEYGSYQEISVKRLVTREAQSNYFLNGTKCRRRDITDLFLGTGLGPRSYAIIEQGMISRLIESRPQELRVFIEEAAGISKYKERRRDTENRMQRTRDNLERLTDVREELTSQLHKLQRQAAAAKRYKELKAEERTLKAQLQALKWLHYQQQCDRVEEQLREQQTELERWVAEQRGTERGQHQLRDTQQELKNSFDESQQSFYQANNDITRLEQNIQHQRQLSDKRRREEDEGRIQLTQLRQHQEEEQQELELIQTQLAELEPEMELAEAASMEVGDKVAQLDDDYQSWQHQQQSIQQQRAAKEQQQRVLVTEQQGIQVLCSRLQQQMDQLQKQLQELDTGQLQKDATELQQNVRQQEQQCTEARQELAQAEGKQQQVDAQLEALQDELHRQQQEVQQLSGRASSLEQLLASANKPVSQQAGQWLADKKHSKSLLHILKTDDEWKLAVEAIAGPWLQAPVVLEPVSGLPQGSDSGRLLFVQPAQLPPAGSLAEKVQGDARYLSLLQEVQVADDEEQAQQLLSQNKAQRVVLKDGRQFGRDWLVGDGQQEEDSQLVWQQTHDHVVAQQQKLQSEAEALQQQKKNLLERQQQLRVQLQKQRQQLMAEQQQLAALQAREQSITRELAQADKRRDELSATQEELDLSLAEQHERLLMIEDEQAILTEQLAADEPEQTDYQQQGEQKRAELQQAREQQQQVQQQRHELQLRVQQLSNSEQHLKQAGKRTENQLQQLQEKLHSLQHEEQGDDIAQLEEDLAIALARREEVELAKNEVAEKLAAVEQELGVLTQGQQGVLDKINQQREKVEASKMELAASRERGHSLLEGLQETGYNLKAVLEAMPEEAEENSWQQRLDKIARSLQQLGAINLAAIEEAEAQAERKAYLDNQYDDLQASLALLEDAIKKIDKETRQRFRKTFDQVNSDLGQLFPKVFGGGSAYLALTDEDLLETGVTIMARPPGKKNSTIHLLSGGEKALTALSLVFAIFRLNPAPFCLLDEVDAPLDDANVGRFCRLVQEMSESVQFIYISHNKIAMEMASHLAGVTMQEPGVSRLVAVDVDEAVAMAEAS